MLPLIVSFFILLTSAFLALILDKRPAAAAIAAAGGCCLACLLGLFSAITVLLSGSTQVLRLAWNIQPSGGEIFMKLDCLSAFFLVPILGLSFLSALYGCGYLRGAESSESAGNRWFFFNLLVSGMIAVTVAANAVFFIFCWEIMALSSFFLVVSKNEDKTVRQAGFIYLSATHIGTAALLLMFMLLGMIGNSSGFCSFGAFNVSGANIPTSLILILGIIGFGMKAGFMPLHVWLPKAHPAAPSHVSALMSGAMIKTGIYGILRLISVLGSPQLWWGWLLISLGLLSGIIGMLRAMAQSDSKKVLAYSSIENIGIISAGIGLAVVGLSRSSIPVYSLALSGALLHMFNHAFFKGMLFMSAGFSAKVCHGRNPDLLGGCAKKMPFTSAAFFIGSASACGLPLSNGFSGKFLIYLAAFFGLTLNDYSLLLPSAAVIIGLSITGCLALACFSGVSGMIFLGLPRKDTVTGTENSSLMAIAMSVCAVVCLAFALAAPLLSGWLIKAGSQVFPLPLEFNYAEKLRSLLLPVSLAAGGVYALILLFVFIRKMLLSGRKVGEEATWNCAYEQVSASMQYTASSFFYPLLRTFAALSGVKAENRAVNQEVFPSEQLSHVSVPSFFVKNLLFSWLKRIVSSVLCLRWLQHGRLHIYILYIVAVLLLLLIWKI